MARAVRPPGGEADLGLGRAASATFTHAVDLPAHFAARHQLLLEHGVNVDTLPAWQRRGVSLWWETYVKTGFDPARATGATATRRRIAVDRELPLRDEYRALMHRVAAPALP